MNQERHNIGQNTANILNEKELDENPVVKTLQLPMINYSLEMILVIGFRVMTQYVYNKCDSGA